MTSEVSGRIRGLEQVGGFGGKAGTLAEGQTFAGDSDFYKKTLASYAAITPAAVRTAMQQWLRRPALTITLVAGRARRLCRSQGRRRQADAPRTTARSSGNRAVPPVGQLAALDFPTITHASLANGIPVDYAQRTTVPLTQLALAFDAGDAADPADQRGLAGADHRPARRGHDELTSQQIAEAEERLGADICAGRGRPHDRDAVGAVANLAPSLDLLAESSSTRPSRPPRSTASGRRR